MNTCPERARQDSPGSRYSVHPGFAIAPAAPSGGRESLAERVVPVVWDAARQRQLVAITLRVMDGAGEWIVHLPNAVLTRSVRATSAPSGGRESLAERVVPVVWDAARQR